MSKLDVGALSRVLVSEFGIDFGSARFLQDENDDVWRIDVRDVAAYLVRVIDSSNRRGSEASVRAAFLDSLSTFIEGVPLMRRTMGGEAESSTINVGVGSYRVEVSQWIGGHDIDPWAPLAAGNAGAALAKFSAASQRLHPRGANWRSYAPLALWARALEELGADLRWSYILGSLLPVFVDLERRLGDAVQVVHGDMHRENFIADDGVGTVRIIDFADVGLGSPWYDFASAFSSLARLSDPMLLKSFVDAYLGEGTTAVPEAPTISALMTARDVAIATHLTMIATDHISLPWVPGRLAELARNCESTIRKSEHPVLPAYTLAVGG
ncbi:MAG TPA: aminoglycoside phosphotransferase family protein [Terracidiphilus sp.]|nr:aminoglycoside phosphotransferase family protein [Terracidiphilus sp.]